MDQQKALDAGADVAGHANVITSIEKGELKMDTVDYLVCHVDSVVDTLKLRGLLKKKMPEKHRGMYFILQNSQITFMFPSQTSGSGQDVGDIRLIPHFLSALFLFFLFLFFSFFLFSLFFLSFDLENGACHFLQWKNGKI